VSKRSNQEPAAARSPQNVQIERGVLTVGACVVQAIIAFYTWVAGLGWSGITYTVAVSQSLLAFGVIILLAAIIRRPWLLFLVPLLSLALTVALEMRAPAQPGP
jgi:uncharacterized membrane protein